MKPSGVIGLCVLALIALFGLSWAIQGNDFFLYKVFAPKYEQVRRETFEQTKSYKQGMVQDLLRMEQEYIKANASHKTALASVILHVSADYPEESMPPDLRQFVRDLKRERGLVR